MIQDMYQSQTSENFYSQTFTWFEREIVLPIKEKCSEFWEKEFSFKLIQVSKNSSLFGYGEENFVTKVKIVKNKSVVFKLPTKTAGIFLDEVFGKNEKDFSFETMTELEANILTEFNNNLFQSFQEKIRRPEKDELDNASEYYITCYMTSDNNEIGRFLVIIPEICITPEPIPAQQNNLTENNFLSSIAEASIKVGETKLNLKDLKSLEKDDFIMLEDSNINKMTLLLEKEYINFNVSPDPSLIIDIDNDGSKSNMTNNIKNVWDSIQIEVGAEFEKIKMSIGELKQISEGLIVDISSVYQNKITLKVEEKTIAEGELVIIDDKYGVRIDKVYDEEKASAESPSIAQDEPEIAQEENIEPDIPQENPNDGNEADFDYSNFDIEDENI